MRLIFNLILALLFMSCSSKIQPQKDIIGVDFDYLDSTIVFSHFKNGIGSLHLYNLRTSEITKLSSPENGFDLRPRFSKDKKNILFLSYRNNGQPHLVIKNLETDKTDTILRNQPFLTEAVFSKDGKEAFFFCASEFKNYSPIVPAANHGFDLFAVDLKSKEIRRITNNKEYVMQSLNLSEDGEHIFCSIPPEEGVVIISTVAGKKEIINFNGNSRQFVQGSFKAISLRNDSALYEAPYEIYSHNFTTNKSEFIIRTPDHSHFQIIRTDSNWVNLIFSTSSNGLFIYNRKTNELRNLIQEIQK